LNTPAALAILELYRTEQSTPDSFIFPYVTSDKDIDTPLKLHNYVGKKTALCNINLKEIAKLAEISKRSLSTSVGIRLLLLH